MTSADIVRLVLAAIFGAFASFVFTAVKSARDEQRDICNQFGEALLKAAEIGTEYWLSKAGDEKSDILQARMLGYQAYLARYRILALGWFSSQDRRQIEEQLATFYDALTGGSFKSPKRKEDPQRAEQCQVLAADVAVLLRAANVRSLALWSMLFRASGLQALLRLLGNQFRWIVPT